MIKTKKALKSKNDKLENEINRSRRQTGPKNSKDFTLVGTSKAGGIDAGLRHFFINFYIGVFYKNLCSLDYVLAGLHLSLIFRAFLLTIISDCQNDKIVISAVHDINELPPAKVKVLVSQLEREKVLLEGQLRNMEWKMDQESKAYHNAKTKLANAESEILKANENVHKYETKL